MDARAHWKGYLKVSLVSCAIALYPAIATSERISFRQVNKRTGNRLRQQLVDTITGETIQTGEKGRGFQIGENELLLVEDEDMAAAQEQARKGSPPKPPEPQVQSKPAPSPASIGAPQVQFRPVTRAPAPLTTYSTDEATTEQSGDEREELDSTAPPSPPRPRPPRTIHMDRFVPAGEMDARYYDTPYFLLPRDAVSQEAYAVIREALARKKMVGLGTVVLATRERPIAVQPAGRGLLGMTLRFNHEVRDAGPYFGQIPDLIMPDELVELAEELIAAKATKFDPALLEDRYRTALVGILRQKQAQQPRKQPSIAEPSRNNVVDLMKTLRRSIAEEQPQRAGERMNSVRRSLKTKKASTRPSASRSGRKTA